MSSRRPTRPALGVLPGWIQYPSGLILPLGAAHEEPVRPLGTVTTETGLAVPERAPSGMDQAAAFLDEDVFQDGVTTSVESLIKSLKEVPFDHVMLVLARMAAKARVFQQDAEAQRQMALAFFQRTPHESAIKDFFKAHPRSVLFSEQQVMVMQRLAIDHAGPPAGFDIELRINEPALARAVIGAGTVVGEASGAVSRPGDAVRLEDLVAFIVRSGEYSRRSSPLGETARYQELLERIAPQLGAERHDKYCPIDEWMIEDYRLSVAEQFRLGLTLAAMAHIFETGPTAGDIVRVLPEHADDLLVKLRWADRRDEVWDLISSDRSSLAADFAAEGSDPVNVVWNVRPWLRHPFIRLDDGSLLLSTPRALFAWMTEGFHYRLLDAAQCRNTTSRRKVSRKYTGFAGALVERYALNLIRSSYATLGPDMEARVHGEQAYEDQGETMTSDVAVDHGTDLVLFEVTARRLRADTVVFGDPDEVAADVKEMVVRKLGQIGDCVGALTCGKAKIPADGPAIDLERVHRIWPVVVTAGPLSQNEWIWEYVFRELGDALKQPRMQPPTLLDLDDLEGLCGLIEAGASLPQILASKTRKEFQPFEFAVWVGRAADAPSEPSHATFVEAAFDRAGKQVLEAVAFSEGLQE